MNKFFNIKNFQSPKISQYGITVNAIDGKYLYVNPSFVEIVGYSEKELLQMSFMDVTHPDDIEKNIDLDHLLAENQMPFFQMKKRYIHKEGHVIHVMLQVGFVRGQAGDSDKFVAMVLNLSAESEEHEIEEELKLLDNIPEPWRFMFAGFELINRYKQKSNRKTRHLANMVHELRTPLNAIHAVTQLLQNNLSEGKSESNQFSLKLLKENSIQLNRLISQILDFEMIELGNFKIEKVELDIFKLLKESTNTLIPFAVQENIDLKGPKEEEGLKEFYGDPDKLRIVFNNLISNGIKYTEKGEVVVSINRPSEKWIEISFKDTGIGIQEEDLKSLFDESKKVSAQISKEIDSVGLGLVISKKIAQLHGGDIEVDSTFGKGSEFKLKLPFQ